MIIPVDFSLSCFVFESLVLEYKVTYIVVSNTLYFHPEPWGRIHFHSHFSQRFGSTTSLIDVFFGDYQWLFLVPVKGGIGSI